MSIESKTILITGSTDGVGRHVGEALAKLGARVLIHGRDHERGERLVEQIVNAGGRAHFYQADFSSLVQVRNLAEAVSRDYPCLDVLINNAGIGVGERGASRELSYEGIELRFAVNYLAGYLLTRLLLPNLKAVSGARIVNVCSIGQQAIDFDNVMLHRGYSGSRAYCQSKLAQVMFTFDLACELKGSGITANSLHPATYMDTTMVRRDGVSPISSVEEGANAILHLVVSSDMEGRTGLYFDGFELQRANPQAYDENARKNLRLISLRLAGLSDDGLGDTCP